MRVVLESRGCVQRGFGVVADLWMKPSRSYGQDGIAQMKYRKAAGAQGTETVVRGLTFIPLSATDITQQHVLVQLEREVHLLPSGRVHRVQSQGSRGGVDGTGYSAVARGSASTMGQLELLFRSTLAAPKEWDGEKSRLHVPILPRWRMSLFRAV